MIPALEALDRLRERNRRFAAGVRSIDSLLARLTGAISWKAGLPLPSSWDAPTRELSRS